MHQSTAYGGAACLARYHPKCHKPQIAPPVQYTVRRVRLRYNRVRMNIPSSGRAVLSRSRTVPLSVPQVLHAAHVPFGVSDPYPADPTHPSAWYTCRAGSQPAISPIPCPWHHARPTCAWRHVRSTFNLSRCLCASLCMCNAWLLHVQMGWACLDWR